MGTRRQVQDCQKLAEARGWTVVDRYVDSDVSAYSGKPRPEYQRLLADIEARQVEAVVVWHVDRLVRQPRELEHFLDVCDAAGVANLASVTGDLDLATHDGRLMARILGAFARKESDDKSRRIRRKAQELAEAGKVGGGGTRPYGFEADRVTVRESEAAVIREAASRVLAGESIRSVTASLNDRAIPTVTGGAWKTPTLRRILSSPRISGQREHQGVIIGPAVWPAILTAANTARIRAIFNDPSRRTTNRGARRYLLVRLLRCGRCGATLVSRPTGAGVRRYACATGPNFAGCGKTYAKAEPLEALVVEAVLYRLDSPELLAAVKGSSDDADAHRWQLEADEADHQLTELAHDWADRLITRAEWLAARKRVEDRLTLARRQLATLSRTSAVTDYLGKSAELRAQWANLPLSRQHAIVAAVLDHVVVKPGRRGYNRFDPTRFEPVWRV